MDAADLRLNYHPEREEWQRTFRASLVDMAMNRAPAPKVGALRSLVERPIDVSNEYTGDGRFS